MNAIEWFVEALVCGAERVARERADVQGSGKHAALKRLYDAQEDLLHLDCTVVLRVMLALGDRLDSWLARARPPG